MKPASIYPYLFFNGNCEAALEFYARLEEPLSEQAWLSALQAGRTFITNGPLLSFTVNDRQAGDTIDVTGGRELLITGRASGRVDFHSVELVCNGTVIATAPSRLEAGHFAADLRHTFPTSEPGWLALRVPSRSGPVTGAEPRNECGEVLFAHSSPVNLENGGKLREDAAAARSLLQDLATARTEIERKGRFADEVRRAEVLGLYEEARARLERLAGFR